ncbi:hypothetical protein ACFLYV_02070 [Chloroflexota bacterium]
MNDLKQYSEKGVNYPVIICEGCQRPIKDASKAIITFQDLVGNPFNESRGVYHKVTCDPGNQAEPYSGELSNYLRRLIANVRLGKIVTDGNGRQLVIDLPEPDGFTEMLGNPDW